MSFHKRLNFKFCAGIATYFFRNIVRRKTDIRSQKSIQPTPPHPHRIS